MKKIQLKKFSMGSIIAAIIMLVIFLIISFRGMQDFRYMKDSTEKYIICQKAAQQMQSGSDILTENVRLYVLTEQREYLDKYFEEAYITKNREHAIEQINDNFDDDNVLLHLQQALKDSMELSKRECYAMRLVLDSLGDELENISDDVVSVSLSEEDLNMTPEQKLEKARSMVSDSIYEQSKAKISSNVQNCMNGLIEKTNESQRNATDIFRYLYIIQEVATFVLMLFMLIDSIAMNKLIINPLVNYNKKIAQDETMPVVGAKELQAFAETYNRMYEENRKSQSLIRHKATHDSLTDLLNKESFNKKLSLVNKSTFPFALIIADIDDFKAFNDTYGHAVGDEIIKIVADTLRSAFRIEDFVFRFGGDEFAIIMVNIDENSKSTIENKFKEINKGLRNDNDELPAIKISMGVAFSDTSLNENELFKNADSALYYTKANCKNSIHFYEK